MPEPSEFAELPPASSLRHLCATTISLAKQLDPLIEYLERTQGYGKFRFSMKRGKLGILHVKRSFKLGEDL